MRSRAALAALLAVLLAATAGCGDDALADFGRAYGAERVELRRAGADVITALDDDEARSDAELAGQLGGRQRRLRRVTARLRRLSAPPEVRPQFQRLLDDLGTMDRRLSALRPAVAAGDLDRAQPLGSRLALDVQAMERARQALEGRLRDR